MNGNQLNEKIVEASKTIFSYCMANTSTREDAEDLCQDILCELVRSSKNIRDSKAFYGFMWAIAGNVYRQWCRKKAKMKTCELTENIAAEDAFADADDTDICLLRRELSLLSEKYRHATILYYVDRMSCSEISHILKISESMVKYLLFKSRKILKEGMNMERRLGNLSYNPKTLVPFYHGSGPNRFGDLMQSKIRQNIVCACYNDSLTPEQISLETGVSLPYLDEEIKALADKEILVRDGHHYKANIIVITSECADERFRKSAVYHNKIADIIGEFLKIRLDDFRKLGFYGADFSDNTLRWQLMTFILAAISDFDEDDEYELPQTAWGDKAYLWFAEKNSSLDNYVFSIAQVKSRCGDRINFFDYHPNPKGDHHDFYGKAQYIDILCNIARGNRDGFSEYDLETVAELIKKGYVLNGDGGYKTAIPVFTAEQYAKAVSLAKAFVDTELGGIIRDIDRLSAKVLSEHTPKHLQSQAAGIAGMYKFVSAACIPTEILVGRKLLNPNWNPLEMPTMHVVLNR